MRKYNVGLLVGRFQPFHLGHLYLIRAALAKVNRLVIGLGSAETNDKDNFLSYRLRRKMIKKVIEKEGWKTRIKKIIPLKDFFNDKLWLDNSLKRSGKIEAVIGNNEWTNGIFEKAGYPILRLGFYKRYMYEGEKIRKLIKQARKWEDRVPEYLIELIKKVNNFATK